MLTPSSAPHYIPSNRQPEPEPDEEPPNDPLGDPPPPQDPAGAGARHPVNDEPPRVPLREVTMDDPIPHRPPRQPAREDLEPPTRRRVPATSSSGVSASSTVTSPYFSSAMASSATLASSPDLASVNLSPVRRNPLPSSTLTNGAVTAEDSFDFSDDMAIDDAFLQELEAAEQAAINTIQQRGRGTGQGTSSGPNAAENWTTAATVMERSEVIVIDSDEDDKENLAPIVERRVRRRIATPDADDSDVIVIE